MKMMISTAMCILKHIPGIITSFYKMTKDNIQVCHERKSAELSANQNHATAGIPAEFQLMNGYFRQFSFPYRKPKPSTM